MLQDTNIAQTSVTQSAMPQIPLVQSTQILTTSTPVLNSQIPMGTASVGQIGREPQNSQQQISLVPVVSAIQRPKQEGRPVVKVVPIYDDF